jgi:hypothetical protein
MPALVSSMPMPSYANHYNKFLVNCSVTAVLLSAGSDIDSCAPILIYRLLHRVTMLLSLRLTSGHFMSSDTEVGFLVLS